MEGCIYIGKAFTNALSWLFGTSQLLNQCQDCSNGRCLMVCLCMPIISFVIDVYTSFNYWYNGLLYTYLREASALLVLH